MMDITLAIADQLEMIVPDATIYRENQEQGFKEPSFYVYEINATSQEEIMEQQMRNHMYCIVWFPDSSLDDPGKKEQCERMRSTLLDEFLFIDGLSLKPMNREASIEQDVLNFTFKVRFKVREESTSENIRSLEINGGLKDG